MPNTVIPTIVFNNSGTTDEDDVRFEIRPERLSTTTDTEPKS
jgi:hypothetical protein